MLVEKPEGKRLKEDPDIGAGGYKNLKKIGRNGVCGIELA
jgi:hypothetical protein